MKYPKIIFKFDKEKDLGNLYYTYRTDYEYGIPKELKSKKKVSQGELVRKIEKINPSLIYDYVKKIDFLWGKIKKKFFNRMIKFMNLPSTFNCVCYITTMKRCPYNPKENWFMISFFSDSLTSLMTIGHEIMHLYFHKFYWKKIEKQIGKEKTEDLKEALTVLLNLEFKDLWFVEDKGYEEHKELRNFISEKWEEEKDFEKLLKKCVNYLKE